MIRWLDIHRNRIFAVLLLAIGTILSWPIFTALQDNYNDPMKAYFSTGRYARAFDWAWNRPEAVEDMNRAIENILNNRVRWRPEGHPKG